MSAPERIEPKTLSDYLLVMSRAVFGAGINWKVIDAKWEGILDAFDGFDIAKVAAYTPEDVEHLMADERVVRNRHKIEAIIRNAGEIIVTDREFGGFDAYLRSFDDNDLLIKDLHKRFAFLGESVAHFFLFGIGYHVPEQEAWAYEHFDAEGHVAHEHGSDDDA